MKINLMHFCNNSDINSSFNFKFYRLICNVLKTLFFEILRNLHKYFIYTLIFIIILINTETYFYIR